jgi:hypothetical protein
LEEGVTGKIPVFVSIFVSHHRLYAVFHEETSSDTVVFLRHEDEKWWKYCGAVVEESTYDLAIHSKGRISCIWYVSQNYENHDRCAVLPSALVRLIQGDNSRFYNEIDLTK